MTGRGAGRVDPGGAAPPPADDARPWCGPAPASRSGRQPVGVDRLRVGLGRSARPPPAAGQPAAGAGRAGRCRSGTARHRLPRPAAHGQPAATAPAVGRPTAGTASIATGRACWPWSAIAGCWRWAATAPAVARSAAARSAGWSDDRLAGDSAARRSRQPPGLDQGPRSGRPARGTRPTRPDPDRAGPHPVGGLRPAPPGAARQVLRGRRPCWPPTPPAAPGAGRLRVLGVPAGCRLDRVAPTTGNCQA